MCLSKQATVLNQDGREYTNENISGLLEFRAASKRIRQSGGKLKGMPKRTGEQDRAFEKALENMLNKSQKDDIIKMQFYASKKNTTVVGRSTDQDSDQVTDQDDAINRLLSALGEEELSAAELMKRLELSHRPTFRKNYLTPALEKDLIERTIPDKPNSKNQKYRRK